MGPEDGGVGGGFGEGELAGVAEVEAVGGGDPARQVGFALDGVLWRVLLPVVVGVEDGDGPAEDVAAARDDFRRGGSERPSRLHRRLENVLRDKVGCCVSWNGAGWRYNRSRA